MELNLKNSLIKLLNNKNLDLKQLNKYCKLALDEGLLHLFCSLLVVILSINIVFERL